MDPCDDFAKLDAAILRYGRFPDDFSASLERLEYALKVANVFGHMNETCCFEYGADDVIYRARIIRDIENRP